MTLKLFLWPCSLAVPVLTPGRRQSKTPILSRNVDQKSIETLFSIAICRPTGDKWQSKTPEHCFYRFLIRVRRLLVTFRLPPTRCGTGRVGLCFLWFYVQELPKAQPAVVLVLKRLRKRGKGLKSHPTDWEKPGIEPATPGLQRKGFLRP